jgi:DnaK suppressor protein
MRMPKMNPDSLMKDFTPYVAKDGEEYMNENQLAHFKSILLNWKQNLMEEVDRTVHHLKEEAVNYADRERKLVKKISQTVELIDADDYGYCEECGIEIGIRRLEARPTATMCIDCKTLAEIKERQIGG